MSVVAPPSVLRQRVDQVSLGAFVIVVVLAVPLLLHLGRDQSFFLDEWWLLGDGAESVGLLEAHNGHWITVPAILYRINYALWGLHTYVPYQVPVVLMHLGSAVLLRVLMRQIGVRGWIATAVALGFVFFGTSSINILFGFQITFTGSLFCGLALLLLADRDGPIGRRDWLAVAVGAVGLMTSGVFVAMVVGVGVAALLRRGPRIAAFYTLPLGVVYSVWYLVFGRAGSPFSLSSAGGAIRFGANMLSATFTALAQSGLLGIALGLFALAAVVISAASALRSRRWAPLAVPAGLLTAWTVFAGFTALARSDTSTIFGVEPGSSDRFLSITAALFLPLIALCAEHLARRNLLVGLLPIIVLAAGIPGNVDELSDRNRIVLGNPDPILTLAHSEHIGDVPPDREPLRPGLFPLPITTGWLARGAEAGRIPEPMNVDPITRMTNYGLLALHQQDRGVEQECPAASEELVPVLLAVGDRIVFEGAVSITVREDLVVSRPIVFTDALGSSIVAELGPLDLRVSDPRGGRPRLCEP